jgi:hypothetical protein
LSPDDGIIIKLGRPLSNVSQKLNSL